MSTYFSRVRLNPTRRGTRRLVGSPQAMHAAVVGAHPRGSSSDDGRVLWRLDRPSAHDFEVYVVSPSQPDFTGLIEQAGWPTLETWESTNYSGFLDRLTLGQHWAFRLTGNPVASASENRDPSGRGKPRPAVTVATQGEWLLRHAAGWGFDLIGVDPQDRDQVASLVVAREVTGFGRRDPNLGGRRRTVELTRADYRGILQVTDVGLLRHALTHGMGRAKAYGCGLMTLARP